LSAPTVVLPNHPLTRLVDDRLALDTAPAGLADALELLLADRAALVGWLTALAADAHRCSWVTRRSYWHVNGFAKLVLHVGALGRIRLHVWPAGRDRLGEPDPHSHRWAFASTVLAGDGLDVVEFAEADTGAGPFTRYVYDGRDVTPDGRVHLRAERQYTVGTRDRYLTDTTVVHTVGPSGVDLVATLLVQGPHLSATTTVYGEERRMPGDVLGHPMDDASTTGLLHAVLGALDREG
jgi:hypothetical protein